MKRIHHGAAPVIRLQISGAANRRRLDWRVFKFQGYNFTMEYYVSHFLVLQRSKPKNIEFPKEVRKGEAPEDLIMHQGTP